MSILASRWLAAVLTAVVVGLVVFAGLEVYDALNPPEQASDGPAQLTDPQERAAVIAAAGDLSQRALSYRHDSFDDDVRRARERQTPEFREEYAAAMEQVRATTTRNRISQQATAVATAIISATQRRAQALVFIDQRTTSARTKASQLVRNRLVVDLERVDGAWAIAGISALG